MTIDLHGVRHEDVPRMLIEVIEASWDSGDHLEVVTGHSKRMKEIVRSIAEEYDLECEDGLSNSGYIWIML